MSTAKQRILGRLHQGLADPTIPWPPVEPPPLAPGEHMHVATLRPDDTSLEERFSSELKKLHGASVIAESLVAARMLTIRKILDWLESSEHQRILAWPELNSWVPGLAENLADREVDVVVPVSFSDPETRSALQQIDVGITGVEAAFAATGSVLLKSTPGKSRIASLLPINHLVLIPSNRLFPNIETWAEQQQDAGSLEHAIRNSANLTLVSGPSKSADIESKLTLGVHGPKELHAVLFPAAR